MSVAALTPNTRVPGIPGSSLSLVDVQTAIQLGLISSSIANKQVIDRSANKIIAGLQQASEAITNSVIVPENTPVENLPSSLELDSYVDDVTNQTSSTELVAQGWAVAGFSSAAGGAKDPFFWADVRRAAENIAEQAALVLGNPWHSVFYRVESIGKQTTAIGIIVDYLFIVWGIMPENLPPDESFNYNKNATDLRDRSLSQKLRQIMI